MPLSLVRRHGSSQPSRSVQAVRLAALALGVTSVAAVSALLLMFAGVTPLGKVNDVLNAALGGLALTLAVAAHRAARQDGRRTGPFELAGLAGLASAAAGAVVLTWGTWLVVTDTTGWVLAGLVSTVGLTGVGGWLLLALRPGGHAEVFGVGAGTLGRVTGLAMVLGVLALPSALRGVDEQAAVPLYGVVGQGVAWLGAYVLLPVWCRQVVVTRQKVHFRSRL